MQELLKVATARAGITENIGYHKSRNEEKLIVFVLLETFIKMS